MASESIRAIKQAEDKVNKLIQDASLRAKEMTKLADKRAIESYIETITLAKEQASQTLKEAELLGKSEVQPIIKEGGREIDKIFNINSAKLNEAIILVTGRIVKKNGNN